MTFNNWLAKQTPTKLPTSTTAECCEVDFILDAKLDSSLPEMTTRAELLDYLRRSNACDGARLGARVAWLRYEKEVSQAA